MQTTLYYREGNSDKVYQVNLQPAGDKFHVTFAYGRRGSTLTGTNLVRLAIPDNSALFCP